MSRGSPGADGPELVDLHVGGRVRLRRRELRMSQSRLADEIEITFQQVQKYESGANRISASKLYEIAHVLKVPFSYFVEGLDEPTAEGAGGYASGWSQAFEELLAEPNGPALVQAFLKSAAER